MGKLQNTPSAFRSTELKWIVGLVMLVALSAAQTFASETSPQSLPTPPETADAPEYLGFRPVTDPTKMALPPERYSPLNQAEWATREKLFEQARLNGAQVLVFSSLSL